MRGDNPSGAGDQQERPGSEQWIVGFVDGEGCFTVPIFKDPTTRLGWQVQPEFVVVQGARSAEVLCDLKEYFGCGTVGINRRFDDHREDMFRFSVKRLGDLDDRIVPFFEEHPLRTAKRREFERFVEVIDMMRRRDSSLPRGSRAHRGDRRDDEQSEAVSFPGILRGHTPAISLRQERRRYGPAPIAI